MVEKTKENQKRNIPSYPWEFLLVEFRVSCETVCVVVVGGGVIFNDAMRILIQKKSNEIKKKNLFSFEIIFFPVS